MDKCSVIFSGRPTNATSPMTEAKVDSLPETESKIVYTSNEDVDPKDVERVRKSLNFEESICKESCSVTDETLLPKKHEKTPSTAFLKTIRIARPCYREVFAKHKLKKCCIRLDRNEVEKYLNHQRDSSFLTKLGYQKSDDILKCRVAVKNLRKSPQWREAITSAIKYKTPIKCGKSDSIMLDFNRNISPVSNPCGLGDPVSSSTPTRCTKTLPREISWSPSCLDTLDGPSIGLLEIKKKIEAKEYRNILEFHQDIKKAVNGAVIGGPRKKAILKSFNSVYEKAMAEYCSWFNLQNPRSQYAKEIPPGISVATPHVDHQYCMKSSAPEKNHEMNRARFWKRKFETLEDNRTCLFCGRLGDRNPNLAGRLIYFRNNEWVHVCCALWSSEVYEEVDGSLQNVFQAVNRGSRLFCTYCGVKGATVGCCHEYCKNNYHFECGLAAGAAYKEDKTVFCSKHKHIYSNRKTSTDFRVRRIVHLELDMKKKQKLVNLRTVQVRIGSLQVENLGYLHPTASDTEHHLVPVGFSCSRYFWSTIDPTRLVKYRCRTKLVSVEDTDKENRALSNNHVTINHGCESPMVIEEKLQEFRQKCRIDELRRAKKDVKRLNIVPPVFVRSLFSSLSLNDLYTDNFDSANPPVASGAPPKPTSAFVQTPKEKPPTVDLSSSLHKRLTASISPTKHRNKAVSNVFQKTPAKHWIDNEQDFLNFSGEIPQLAGTEVDDAFISSILCDENIVESELNLSMKQIVENDSECSVMKTWFNQLKRKKFTEVMIQCSLPYEKDNIELDLENDVRESFECETEEFLKSTREEIFSIENGADLNAEELLRLVADASDAQGCDVDLIKKVFLSMSDELQDVATLPQVLSNGVLTGNIPQVDGSDESEADAMLPPKVPKIEPSGNDASPKKDFSIAGLLLPHEESHSIVRQSPLAPSMTPPRPCAPPSSTSHAQTVTHQSASQHLTPSSVSSVQPSIFIQHLSTPELATSFAKSFEQSTGRPLQYVTSVNSLQELGSFPSFQQHTIQLNTPSPFFQPVAAPFQGFVAPQFTYITPSILVNPQTNIFNLGHPATPVQGPSSLVFNPPALPAFPTPSGYLQPGPSTPSATSLFPPPQMKAPAPHQTFSGLASSASHKKVARVQPQPWTKDGRQGGLQQRLDPIKALSNIASHPMAASVSTSQSSNRLSIVHGSSELSRERNQQSLSEASGSNDDVVFLSQTSKSTLSVLKEFRRQKSDADRQRSVGTQAKLGGPLKIMTPRPWRGADETESLRKVPLPLGSETLSSGVSVQSSGNSSLAGSRPSSNFSSVVDLAKPQTPDGVETLKTTTFLSSGIKMTKEKSSDANKIKIVMQQDPVRDKFKIEEIYVKAKCPEEVDTAMGLIAQKVKTKVSKRVKRFVADLVVPMNSEGKIFQTEDQFVNEQEVVSLEETSSDVPKSIWRPVENRQEEEEDGTSRSKIVYEMTSEDGFKAEADDVAMLWQKVFEAVEEARFFQGLEPTSVNPFDKTGYQMIGLAHGALAYLIEQLPGAMGVEKYNYKYHKLRGDARDDVQLKPNETGCARTETYKGRKPFDMFSWLASKYRKIPRVDDGTPAVETSLQVRQLRQLELPMAMRYRHLAKSAKESVGVFKSGIHGRGLYCKREIMPGEMVIEYTGEEIRPVLTDKREKFYESRGIGCYMFKIDDEIVVDATMKGNAARFINHSCDPNCYSKIVDVLGKKHIIIFAQRKIEIGEELTYDYKFPFEDNKIACHCSSKKCRKYMN